MSITAQTQTYYFSLFDPSKTRPSPNNHQDYESRPAPKRRKTCESDVSASCTHVTQTPRASPPKAIPTANRSAAPADKLLLWECAKEVMLQNPSKKWSYQEILNLTSSQKYRGRIYKHSGEMYDSITETTVKQSLISKRHDIFERDDDGWFLKAHLIAHTHRTTSTGSPKNNANCQHHSGKSNAKVASDSPTITTSPAAQLNEQTTPTILQHGLDFSRSVYENLIPAIDDPSGSIPLYFRKGIKMIIVSASTGNAVCSAQNFFAASYVPNFSNNHSDNTLLLLGGGVRGLDQLHQLIAITLATLPQLTKKASVDYKLFARNSCVRDGKIWTRLPRCLSQIIEEPAAFGFMPMSPNTNSRCNPRTSSSPAGSRKITMRDLLNDVITPDSITTPITPPQQQHQQNEIVYQSSCQELRCPSPALSVSSQVDDFRMFEQKRLSFDTLMTLQSLLQPQQKQLAEQLSQALWNLVVHCTDEIQIVV